MYISQGLDDLDGRMDTARRVLRMENPEQFIQNALDREKFNLNLLFGYLRSFVKLAYAGDIRRVAQDLDTSRQTVARHIHELENMLNADLFHELGVSSRLTERGVLWLPRALEICELARDFSLRCGANPADYQSTQLPLRMLFKDEASSSLLRSFVRKWELSETKDTACSCFDDFRDCWIIYERRGGRWASREIGANSAFAQFYGTDFVRPGMGLDEMAGADDMHDEVCFLLDSLYTRGGVHFSEVSCRAAKPGTQERQSILYQRALVEVSVGDKPQIASVIEILQTTSLPD